MNEQAFVITEENGILILTMQAEGNNLMTASFFEGYESAMAEIEKRAAENSYRGMIICGGGRHFSVGADVESLSERSARELPVLRETGRIPDGHFRQKHFFTFLNGLPFPVVSVVMGFCIGSGSEIAANSHFRIVEKNARIGQPESTFGILPALGGIARSIVHTGMQNAFEIVVSGELFTADKAAEILWANELVGKKAGMARAKQLIDFISGSGEKFSADKAADFYRRFLELEAAE